MNRRDFLIGTVSLSVGAQSVSASSEGQPSSKSQTHSEGVQIAGSHCSTCERMWELLYEINHGSGSEQELSDLRWLGYVPGHYHSKKENCFLTPLNVYIEGMNYKFDVEKDGFERTRVKATVITDDGRNPWVRM